MADASGERRGYVNAAIKVVVRFDDGETRTWTGTGSWGDGLADSYTASREGYRPEGTWIWEGDAAARSAVATIRVDDNLTGKTGKSGAAGGTQVGATGTRAPTEAEAKEVSEFERSIGIDPSVETEHGWGDTDGRGDPTGGNKPGGQGQSGGDPEGRTGDDTRLGGTGPSGNDARRGRAGKGSEDGGRGGAEGGSRDGEQGGSEGGMYGGEGKLGADGVPSGGGMLGLVAVPAFLKGFVELALILSEADFAGFGKRAAAETIEQLVKAGAKNLGETGADTVESVIRAALASRARVEAAKATKTVTKTPGRRAPTQRRS